MQAVRNIVENVFAGRNKTIGILNYKYHNEESIDAETFSQELKVAIDNENIAIELFFCMYCEIKDKLPKLYTTEDIKKIQAMFAETPKEENSD